MVDLKISFSSKGERALFNNWLESQLHGRHPESFDDYFAKQELELLQTEFNEENIIIILDETIYT